MSREKRDVEDALRRKGFETEERHHHYFLYKCLDGRLSRIRTRTSHSAKVKSLSDQLLSQMASQCKITKKEFLELVDCQMSQDIYEKLLNERNFL